MARAGPTMNQEAQRHRPRDLIAAFVPNARRIARQTAQQLGRPEEVDDCVGAALEGLTEAGARFDPSRGVTFQAFARHRVRGAIVDALRAHDFVPRSVRDRARAIERANHAFVATHGRPPCEAELAATLGLSASEARSWLDRADVRPMVSLAAPLEDGVHPDAPWDDRPDAVSALVHAQERDALREALTRLPERERLAIGMFYLEERSLRVIGAAMGVSVSRVSHLCSQGIRRLRAAMAGCAG